ncbi:MAG: primosomal protein N', partial [Betaproteobacteria bacterium]|nr:primosomal protein N' [Betaproteobacteria bacterium]
DHLRCHHCGHEQPVPTACPNCASHDLRAGGHGTQRVEEHLIERFPEARILRVDRDSTRQKGAFAAMREAIQRHEVDLIVGTQILAKGHDFPDLTQVGVIGADHALQAPDFRASERLFAQLMQVSGRAGRATKPGTVWIQTDWPQHPLFVSLRQHDYASFARHTLRERQESGLPPFMHLAVLRADASHMSAAMAFLEAARLCLPNPEKVTVFDPVPALMARLAHRERAQLLVQATRREALQAYLRQWVPLLQALPLRGVRWSLDVDPSEF